MIVVADTSPINYLIQIECEQLLPALFGRILVPASVMQELARPGAPAAVRGWSSCPPKWVEIGTFSAPVDIGLAFLDLGEREAIQLCEELHGNLLLIDELRGRREAERRGIRVTGILGVLLAAGKRDLVDAEAAFCSLRKGTSFRVSAALETLFLERIQSPQG